MPIGIMGSKEWRSLIEVNSVPGRKSINTRVWAVSFCHDEMPLASTKPPLITITHNAFRPCRVSLYTFVGHVRELHSPKSAGKQK